MFVQLRSGGVYYANIVNRINKLREYPERDGISSTQVYTYTRRLHYPVCCVEIGRTVRIYRIGIATLLTPCALALAVSGSFYKKKKLQIAKETGHILFWVRTPASYVRS